MQRAEKSGSRSNGIEMMIGSGATFSFAHFLFEDGNAARAALEAAGIEVLAERECSFSD